MAEKRTGRQYQELKESVKALFDEAGSVVKETKRTTPKAGKKRKPGTKKKGKSPEDHRKITLSKTAHKFLKEERQKTGETIPAILERIIKNVASSSSDRNSPGAIKEEKPSVPPPPVTQDYELDVLNRLASMKENDKLSFDEIAERFNKEGLKTLSGKGKWHGITLLSMYDRLINR